jgi:hypothetical protein
MLSFLASLFFPGRDAPPPPPAPADDGAPVACDIADDGPADDGAHGPADDGDPGACEIADDGDATVAEPPVRTVAVAEPPARTVAVAKPLSLVSYALLPSVTEIENALPAYAQLDVGRRAGTTGYIDYIMPGEMKEAAVVRGCDSAKRPFFVARGWMKVEVPTEDENDGGVFSATIPWMQTFFRRYTDNHQLWVGCGHGWQQHLFESSGGISEYQAKILALLLGGAPSVDIVEPIEARVLPVLTRAGPTVTDSQCRATVWLDAGAVSGAPAVW